MTHGASDGPLASALAVDLSRRRLMSRVGFWAALAAAVTGTLPIEAAAPAETPVDADRLNGLLVVSKSLCGGGTFDPDRGAMLYRFLVGDPVLAAGLAELLATPPVEGTPLSTEPARAAAEAVLLFWYAGEINGAPVPDRATAYYGLTAWQAMYTPPWAVCKAFGAWADPPRTDPLVPSN